MHSFKKHRLVAGLVLAGAMAPGSALADAIITNGTVKLGVDDLGQLNIAGGTPSANAGEQVVGLRFIQADGSELESTSHGCLCEGWGVGLLNAGISGYANNSLGTANLSSVSFTSTASTATSVVDVLDGTGNAVLRVTHDYRPSSNTDNLYLVDVSITNNSGAALVDGDLVYRRVMDWDIEPTTFNENVTIQGVPAALGVANGNNVRSTGDDGFATADPLVANNDDLAGCGLDTNFVDCGPDDHGALFDFEFEGLGVGETRVFTTAYGAAATEALADAARAAEGVNLYSYGQTSTDPSGGTPATHIFGFVADDGVLPPPEPPPSVPVPGTLALLGLGLVGLRWSRRAVT